MGVGTRNANSCAVIVQARCGRRDVLQIAHRPGDRGESNHRDEQHAHYAAPNSVARRMTRTFYEPHNGHSIPESETATLTFLNESVRTVAVQAVCKSPRQPMQRGQRPPQQVPSVETVGDDAGTDSPWSVTASSAMPQTWQWPWPAIEADRLMHRKCPLPGQCSGHITRRAPLPAIASVELPSGVALGAYRPCAASVLAFDKLPGAAARHAMGGRFSAHCRCDQAIRVWFHVASKSDSGF